MTIGKKLFVWFMVPVTLAVVLGIFSFVNSRNIDRNINILIEEDWKRADSSMELRIGIGLLGSSVAILETLAYEDTDYYKEKVKETIRESDQLVKLGKAKFIDGFEKLVELERQVPNVLKLEYTMTELKQSYDTMIDALDKMKKAFLARDAITALSIKEKEFDPHLLELQVTLLEEAEEFADATVEASEMKIKKITAKNVTMGVALTIVIVIVGLAFSLIICRVISKPIVTLKNATIEIGKGKFDKIIEIKSKDEIGELADASNKMVINLRESRDNLRQSEKRYKDLSSQIISVQEEERRRISRELHDETGQTLTAIKMNLEMMEKEIPEKSSKIRQRLTDTKQLLARTIKEVRSLSFELSSSLLDDFGLLVAIREYSKNFSERSNIITEVHGKDIVERFPPEIEILFYCCAQEALNNIAKHSDAKNVTIHMILNETELCMRIKDDGKGFDVRKHFEKNMSGSGIGLFGMRERVALMDGKLIIHSEKIRGTVLEIMVPLRVP